MTRVSADVADRAEPPARPEPSLVAKALDLACHRLLRASREGGLARRLAERVLDPRRLGFASERVVASAHGVMLLSPASQIEFEILLRGCFEPEISEYLRATIRRDWVCIDMGANVGVHTLTAARCAPEGRVIAFEPNPRVRERLLRNLALNRLENVSVIPVAVGDETGEADLHLPPEGEPNQGLSSLLPKERLGAGERVRVPTARLEDVAEVAALERCDLIKIDVEGFEPRVLPQCRDLIARYRPLVIFEYSRSAWSDLGATLVDATGPIAALGYEFYAFSGRTLRPCLPAQAGFGYADILAVPRVL